MVDALDGVDDCPTVCCPKTSAIVDPTRGHHIHVHAKAKRERRNRAADHPHPHVRRSTLLSVRQSGANRNTRTPDAQRLSAAAHRAHGRSWTDAVARTLLSICGAPHSHGHEQSVCTPPQSPPSETRWPAPVHTRGDGRLCQRRTCVHHCSVVGGDETVPERR